MASSLSSICASVWVKAVAEGASRRQAAARFGVSVASAIRWQESFEREAGSRPSRAAATGVRSTSKPMPT